MLENTNRIIVDYSNKQLNNVSNIHKCSVDIQNITKTTEVRVQKNIRLQSCNLHNVHIPTIRFDTLNIFCGCFDNVSANGTYFYKSNVSYVILKENCDFSGVTFKDCVFSFLITEQLAIFKNVTFNNCYFNNCRINANFENAKFNKCLFNATTLTDPITVENQGIIKNSELSFSTVSNIVVKDENIAFATTEIAEPTKTTEVLEISDTNDVIESKSAEPTKSVPTKVNVPSVNYEKYKLVSSNSKIIDTGDKVLLSYLGAMTIAMIIYGFFM